MWGVLFTGGDAKPLLLGSLWNEVCRKGPIYDGEPTRALVFQTRESARNWCHEQMDKYKDRNDLLAQWKFRPVRVIETVEVTK